MHESLRFAPVRRVFVAFGVAASVSVLAASVGVAAELSAQSLTVPSFIGTFDGSNWADLGPSAGNLGAADFTIKFSVNTTAGGIMDLVSKRSCCCNDNFLDVRMSDGQVEMEIDQDGFGYAAIVSSQVINDGAWHRVKITRHGHVVSLRIDNTQTERIDTPDNAAVDNSYPLLVGTGACVDVDGTVKFTGSIRDLKITQGESED